jgi:hypothetical protein
LIAREFDVDVFEVVLLGAVDDEVGHGFDGGARALSR